MADERPILMCGDMVRATLERRKRRTRRAWKLPKGHDWYADLGGIDKGFFEESGMPGWWHVEETRCPYGKVGDRLWVRETWRECFDDTLGVCIEYRADGRKIKPNFPSEEAGWKCEQNAIADDAHKWRPSIFMPRWASRIVLEVTEVRIERLQAITSSDIIDEGVQYPVSADGRPMIRLTGKCPTVHYHRRLKQGEGLTHDELLRCHFASLWDTINGEGSWAANPWVWVVGFSHVDDPEVIRAAEGGR